MLKFRVSDLGRSRRQERKLPLFSARGFRDPDSTSLLHTVIKITLLMAHVGV